MLSSDQGLETALDGDGAASDSSWEGHSELSTSRGQPGASVRIPRIASFTHAAGEGNWGVEEDVESLQDDYMPRVYGDKTSLAKAMLASDDEYDGLFIDGNVKRPAYASVSSSMGSSWGSF